MDSIGTEKLIPTAEIMCQSNACSTDDWLRFETGIKIFHYHLTVGFLNFLYARFTCKANNKSDVILITKVAGYSMFDAYCTVSDVQLIRMFLC